jgi:S-formylglutathione hydrolase
MQKYLIPLFTLFFSTVASAAGNLEIIQVEGAALAGNLGGEDTVREVYVYLPEGYADNTHQRYPVIYFLHGYGVRAQIYSDRVLHLPESLDIAFTGENSIPAIVVMPDAYTSYGGSMYTNSANTGNWEDFIAKDLVKYVDSHYRTKATRASRGLSGHSMGGYGTLRIVMKYPEVFSAAYAMSSCCLLNQAPSEQAVTEQEARMAVGSIKDAGGFNNVLQAQAAAWAANPDKPPYYFDWPWQGGESQPLIQGKWGANSPLLFVDQYVPALQSLKALALDVGDKDSLEATNTQLDAALTRLRVPHSYEIYEGDHGNKVGLRFVDELLPFFARHLE